MLAVLRRPSFALLWTGGLISTAGDRMLLIALPFFVYQRTGSTVATAAMIVAELVPSVLLGSIAGVLVDRWDRRRILVITNMLQALAVLLLLLVQGDEWLWVVYVVAAAQSSLAAFAAPAEGALLPSLVEERDLVPANSLNALNNRAGRLIGAPLGGAILAAYGLPAIVFIDCLTFVAAGALIARISLPPGRSGPIDDAAVAARSAWAAFWADWLDGLRLIGGDRTVAILLLVLGLGTFGGTMLDPLSPAWVQDVLGEGPEVYAWLSTTHAASGILGTLLVGWSGARLSPRALIGWSSVIAGCATAVKYNLPSVPLALLLSGVVGVTSVASSVGIETQAQRSVRDEYRGRVFGSLNSTLALLSLTGGLVAGVLGEVIGIVPTLGISAALILLSGLVALRAFSSQPIGSAPTPV